MARIPGEPLMLLKGQSEKVSERAQDVWGPHRKPRIRPRVLCIVAMVDESSSTDS